MIKTVVTPKINSVHVDILNDYIGKEIEILVYAIDELIQEKLSSKKTMADFNGILTEYDYQSIKSHTEQARKEWNRDI